MKKFLVLMLVVVFALSGVALAETPEIKKYDTNEGNIKQTGTFNLAVIDQHGIINLANVNQKGNHNLANVFQKDWQAQNIVTTLVDQTGNWNLASVWQYDSVDSNVARPRNVEILQVGDQNAAFAVQNFGGYMTAHINQSGQSNSASQWQKHNTGMGWIVGQITQEGTSNTAFQTQSGVNGSLWASIYQKGNNNLAIEFQSRYVDGKNTARITQKGDNNFGIVTQ